MRFKNILLLLSGILSLGLASWAKSPEPNAVHYKVRLQSEAFGNMGTREFWLKGSKMRMDVQSARLPLRILKNDQGVFLVHAWNKIAGKYPDDSPRGNPRALLPGPTGSTKTFLTSVKATKQKRETVDKQSCDVYTYIDPVTKRTCKLWVNAKSGKPVKLWLKGKRKVMDTITATYTVFEEGVKVPDSFFNLPKGYKVRPMPKMDLTSKGTVPKLNTEKSGT